MEAMSKSFKMKRWSDAMEVTPEAIFARLVLKVGMQLLPQIITNMADKLFHQTIIVGLMLLGIPLAEKQASTITKGITTVIIDIGADWVKLLTASGFQLIVDAA